MPMDDIPKPIRFYYAVSRERQGLDELQKLLGDASVKINGAMGELGTPLFMSCVTYFYEDIAKLLIEAGADPELTRGDAEKYPMPDLSAMSLSGGASLAGAVAKAGVKRAAIQWGGQLMRMFGLGSQMVSRTVGVDNGSTGVRGIQDDVMSVQERRRHVKEWVEKETASVQRNYPNIDALTPFAGLVLKGGKLHIQHALESGLFNPLPMVGDKRLDEVLEADGRGPMAETLRKAAEAKAAGEPAPKIIGS